MKAETLEAKFAMDAEIPLPNRLQGISVMISLPGVVQVRSFAAPRLSSRFAPTRTSCEGQEPVAQPA
jgi:hypothetical protein